MGRPDPGHEARTRRGLRDMAGGTLDGLLEIPAPISPSAGPIRISRLGPDRVPPEPDECLAPYDGYDDLHVACPVVLPTGEVVASIARSDGGTDAPTGDSSGQASSSIGTAIYPSASEFLDEIDADSEQTVVDRLDAEDARGSLETDRPSASVARAGGRTWLTASWKGRDGDFTPTTRLYESTDDGRTWQPHTTLSTFTYDPADVFELRLTPGASQVTEHNGFLFVMGARWGYMWRDELVGNTWGMWRSADGGDTWQLMFTFRNGPINGSYTNAIARNLVSHGSRLYAMTTDDYGGGNNRLRYSDDDGVTWHVAWNLWRLPWDRHLSYQEAELFWTFSIRPVGGQFVAWFTSFGGSPPYVVVATADDPTDLDDWEEVDRFTCEVGNVDALAYQLDGRDWFEHYGRLTEYIPT